MTNGPSDVLLAYTYRPGTPYTDPGVPAALALKVRAWCPGAGESGPTGGKIAAGAPDRWSVCRTASCSGTAPHALWRWWSGLDGVKEAKV
ncbi:hypothetical protein GCM10009825_38630 [Arthrobacter humicola]|uniref:Uncharacterized protein n=1 Tax=Arthrobacter humicola TaxID=409291 RepID=A0ABN2ZPX2_9MICC